jgi:putative FmdB family regulatory protein
MPTYVYRCKSCGHRFEAWQHMTDDPLTTCPQCEGEIQRVLFPASVVFKGSGFYSTDARPSSALTDSGPAKSEGESASPPKTETAATTEVKPSPPIAAKE